MQVKILLFSLLLVLMSSCKDDVSYHLDIDNDAVMVPTALEETITVGYRSNDVNLVVSVPEQDSDWCTVTIADGEIIIVILENSSFESRSTLVTISGKEVSPKTITVEQPGREAFSSFIIPAALNGIAKDIVGEIDNVKNTITISTNEFIGNVKEMILTFESTNEVRLGDDVVESGVTTVLIADNIKFDIYRSDRKVTSYTLIAKGPMFTGLSVISINLDDEKEVVEKTVKLPGVLNLVDFDNDGYDLVNVDMTLRGRGNSTWGSPKKPYRIDFIDKQSMFGHASAKKWILLANYQDPTLLMNDVTFELGRRLGMEFTHSSHHVELFVNGTYRGNYQLTEQKEIGKGRVDVDKKKGFLVELDSYYDEDYKFRSNHLNLPVMVADPSLKSESEMDYIKDAFQALEDALFEDDFPNNSYENHTEVSTLIDFIMVNEIVRNDELGHPKSTYCYKDADTKIKWGPLWDFDWDFGFDASNYYKHEAIMFSPTKNAWGSGGAFFNRFFQIPGFVEQYKQRWAEVKPVALSMLDYISEMEQKLEKSQSENFGISINKPSTMVKSYSHMVEGMRNWLQNRIEMLDKEIGEM